MQRLGKCSVRPDREGLTMTGIFERPFPRDDWGRVMNMADAG